MNRATFFGTIASMVGLSGLSLINKNWAKMCKNAFKKEDEIILGIDSVGYDNGNTVAVIWHRQSGKMSFMDTALEKADLFQEN